MKKRATICLFIALLAPLMASGCSSQCADIKKDWEDWKADASPFVLPRSGAGAGSGDIHLGVSMRVSTLNKLLNQALESKLDEALEFSDKLSVATGNSIAVRTDGSVADLGLFPDKACETCLRVEGKLDGMVAVKVPILGEQGVPLRGTFQLVGPVAFDRTDDGRGAVKLDLSKVAELNASRVSAEIAQLPPTWRDALESPLSGRILSAIGKQLGPVTLFTFDPLDLGVAGLEVTPATIVTDYEKGIIFAGFHTNLRGGSGGLQPFTDLGKNENVAFVVDPGIVASAVTALQQAGELSEAYDEAGQEAADGPFRAAVNLVSAAPAGQASQGAAYSSSFRVWRFEEGEKCYWADAKAIGRATIIDDEVQLAVQDVELTESSMDGVSMAIANWAFLSRIDKVIATSLSTSSLNVPGSEVSLGSARLMMHGPGLAVAGKLIEKE